VFVYKLEYESLVLYVGRTVDMKRRYREHCRRRGGGSSEIPADMAWSMILLEECEDALGVTREQNYYDTLKPLYNRNRPGQTDSEYKRAHPEKSREYCRKYDAANREARNAKRLERHHANREACNAKRKERYYAKKQSNAVLATQSQEEVAS